MEKKAASPLLAWAVPGRGEPERITVCGAAVLRCPMPEGEGRFARWRRGLRFRRLRRCGIRRVAAPEKWCAEAEKWGLRPLRGDALRRAVLREALKKRSGTAACIRSPRPGREAEETALLLARRFRYLRLDIPRSEGLERTLLRRFGVSGASAGEPELTVSLGGPPRSAEEWCLGEDCCVWQEAAYAPVPGWEGPPLPEPLLCALWSGGYIKKEEIRLKMLSPRA